MQQGAIVAGRFRLLRRAGTGGMGSVFHADDLRTGRHVALKTVSQADATTAARFTQEARTLASVRHPAIVGYIDHGVAEDGSAYLAMEWLEGEDLAENLARGPLAPDVALALGCRVAEGLAALHAAGIVHRDLKPANLVLEGKDATRVRIVDLGIARLRNATRGLTRTGTVIGTVGYMAPEQIDGQRDLDARADIFALGCVLYECLTGRRAFAGEHVIAVLARMLLEDAPRLGDLVPDAPPALDALLARCMARDRDARPRDGAELLALLRELPALDATLQFAAPSADVSGLELRGERRPIGVVLARSAVSASDHTLDVRTDAAIRASVDEIAARWGGRALRLTQSVLAVVVEQPGGVRAQAARTARAALELAVVLPDWALSAATPSAETSGGWLLAAVLERAAERLDQATPASTGPSVRLDAVTAALLDASFDVDEAADGPQLRGYSPARDDARPLLGRLTPCVGRDKELRLLESTLAECEEEHAARAVLLLGEGGLGKSKLRRELVARVRDRGGVRVLQARAHTAGMLSAFALLRDLLADAAQLAEHASSERYAALDRYLRPLLMVDGAANETLEILAEIAGAPPPSPGSVLQVARLDPTEMRWRVADAVLAWLRAEAREGAVVLSLEDLHDADPSSVAFLTEAWRALADRPILLVGTARPEVENTHPALLTLRDLHLLRLGPIGKRAAERLVRQALGESTPEAIVMGVVERADGHPFLLEELVRHVAAGHALSEVPGSVLALLQSRLLGLDAEARRALRAASVFGEQFPAEGAASLLGGEAIDETLERLAAEELLVAPRRGDASGVHVFRHAYVRDAAYAMLPAEERGTAHLAAARWFAARTDPDAVAVAEHLTLGGDAVGAAPWFLRAAHRGGEQGAAVEGAALAQRGQVEGVELSLFVDLLLEEQTYLWSNGKFEQAFHGIRERAPWSRLEIGSVPWVALKSFEIGAAGFLGHNDVLFDGAHVFLALPSAPPLTESWGRVFGLLVPALLHLGLMEEATRFTQMAASAPLAEGEEKSLVYLHWTLALCAGFADDGRAIAHARRCLDGSSRLNHRDRYVLRGGCSMVLVEFGYFDEALVQARATRQAAPRCGYSWAHDWALAGELYASVFGAQPASVEHLAAEMLLGTDLVNVAFVQISARLSTALASPDDRGVVDAVFRDLEEMVELLAPISSVSGLLLGALAHLELMRERPADALAFIERALSGCRTLTCMTRSWLTFSQLVALVALSRNDEARTLLAQAQARIERIAQSCETDADRNSFRAHPISAQILAFAVADVSPARSTA